MIRENATNKKSKKRMAGLLAAAMLITSLAAGGYAFETADPVYAAASTTPAAVTPATMTFGGAMIKLSLDQAVTRMQTIGSDAETALLNKQSDESIARGYREAISEYYDMGATKQIESKIASLRKEFALTQTAANYSAELNEIEAKTVELYYGILQAEENLRVAKDSLANEKTIYANTLKKFKLGTVAKIDTLTAQTAVLKAEADIAEAQTAVASARMNFNLLLGYDLMQQVTLTDTLKQVAAPKGTLTDWISGAVKNRNEIKGSAFAEQIYSVIINNLKLTTSPSSSTFLKQQVAYLESKKAAKDAPLQIQMDIRVKSMDLADKARAVETAKATLANAKEGYRLAVITYDAGMNTLTDVQEAQIKSYQAGQAVNAAIVAYDLAVSKFEHAIGVGTTRIAI